MIKKIKILVNKKFEYMKNTPRIIFYTIMGLIFFSLLLIFISNISNFKINKTDKYEHCKEYFTPKCIFNNTLEEEGIFCLEDEFLIQDNENLTVIMNIINRFINDIYVINLSIKRPGNVINEGVCNKFFDENNNLKIDNEDEVIGADRKTFWGKNENKTLLVSCDNASVLVTGDLEYFDLNFEYIIEKNPNIIRNINGKIRSRVVGSYNDCKYFVEKGLLSNKSCSWI